MRALLSPLLCCAFAALPLHAQSPAKGTPQVPGVRPDGAVLLPNQWTLRPVGRQIAVGDFPSNLALHPGGRFLAVLHSGHGENEVTIIDLGTRKTVSRAPVEESFYGLGFSHDGTQLFCSGAGDEVVHAFKFERGFLSDRRELALRDPQLRGVPGGIAVSNNGEFLYVTNVWGHSVSRVALNGAQGTEPSELPLREKAGASPAPARPESTDDPSITKRAAALLEEASSDDPFPYACVLDDARKRLYVSLWGQGAVAVVDTESFTVTGRWPVEEHPNEMLFSRDRRHLFVANANRNSVSVLKLETGKIAETLIAELKPGSPPGNTPNSLALSPDGKRLFVANANINTVAVFDVSEIGKSRSLGFIPVGWYPTSVRVTPDGKQLLVANGKGMISRANRNGPKPGLRPPPTTLEYIGGLMNGTVSIIDLPAGEALEKSLVSWTARAFQCMPEPAANSDDEALIGNPIPRKIGDPSPIKYVIYIVKENRTFDQVLGDFDKGNADPSLCIFPEAITPNHHALARDFVLLDNFYVESEVSADGHEWTLGGYASDFVEKTWPLSYGHDKRKKLPYPSEGNFPIARPAGGYLWDRAREAKVSYRSYGEFVRNGKTPADPATTKVAALKGHFDPQFRSFDMDYPDVKRAERFISELHRFETEGEMPRLQILRLPNDHTSGASPGKPTPIAHLADNDLAFGQVVEAVSKSKFWPQTAIFVVEDDAQNGSDHVDAHRTIAFAISPYVRRGTVDSTLYSTSSMLRTMELILGLKPMSQFDAAAIPMFASFRGEPDLSPYTVRPVTSNREEKAVATAWGARESQQMDFSEEDAADDLLLNEIIWRNVRGADSAMPAPRRAAFVFTKSGAEKDDD